MAAINRLRDVCFAFVSGGAADAVCQAIEVRFRNNSGQKQDKQASTSFDLDGRRLLAFSAFTGIYIGGCCGYIYALYPWVARRLLRRAPSAKEEGVVASLLDNFLHVPALYIPTFYLGTNLMRGEGLAHATEALRSNWKESVSLCVLFWLPAQYVIFSAVPAAARVRCVAAGDFAWNVVLSYLAHRVEEAPADVLAGGAVPPQRLSTARTGTIRLSNSTAAAPGDAAEQPPLRASALTEIKHDK